MLAVFCIEGDRPDSEARKLVEERKALLLLKQHNRKYCPNHEDVLEFVNALLRARWLSIQTQILQTVNADLVRCLGPDGADAGPPKGP
jgi:hypothetical protein